MKTLFARWMAMCLALAAFGANAQTKPQFEVASIKPTPPIDFAALRTNPGAAASIASGIRVTQNRAEFNRQSLADLIVFAWGFKSYQISGATLPDNGYDISAKLPDGASKADVPKMLQSLLEDRFRLAVHTATEEKPVLALVVAKGGLKMTPSNGVPAPIDPASPLQPGERQTETESGLMRTLVATGSDGKMTLSFNLGARGKLSMRTDPGGASTYEIGTMTMSGLADVFAQLFVPLLVGPGIQRQVVDRTGLQGNFDGSMVRSPLDPSAVSDQNAVMDALRNSLETSIASLGLKLESSKAVVSVLIVDHVEKTPTAN